LPGGVVGNIIKAVISVAIGFVTGGPWGAALAFAGSALGFVLGAIAPKPKSTKQKNGANLDDFQQVLRQSVSPRHIIYGTAVKSGVLLYSESTGSGNKYLHLVIVLAAHHCKATLDHWFNDEIIGAQDSNGNVTAGRFKNWARVKSHLGDDDQLADDDLVAESAGNWTSSHRLRGRVYRYDRLTWDRTTYPNGIPNPKSKVVGEDGIYDLRDGQTRWTNNWALVIYNYLTRAKRDGGWGEAASSLDADDWIAAANLSDQAVPVVSQSFTVTANAATDELVLTDADFYVWSGDGVQISATGTLPAGLSGGVTYFWIETGQSKGQLGVDLMASRNRTAIELTSAGTGTITLTRVSQPRYTIDGVIPMDSNKMDVLEDMVQAGAGWLAKCQGKFRIWAGAETDPEPGIGIDGSWLRDGEIGLVTRPSIQDLFNTARGTYIDPARFWKENPFPPVTSNAYKAEDNDQELAQDFQFPYQLNGERGQRVAAILLNRHRLSDTLTLPCNWKAWPLRLGQVVPVTLPIFGYADATFRVMNWKRADNFAGIDLVLQRDDPSSYAWTPGQAQTYASAPPVSLFEPWNVAPPTNFALIDDPIVGTGGSVPAIKGTWIASDDAFVSGYQLEFKQHSDSDWISAGIVTASPGWIYPVTTGTVYDIRITAIRSNGAKSVPVELDSFTAGGDAVAPGAPTAITATAGSGGIQLAWTNDPASDLAIVEVWRNTSNTTVGATKIQEVASAPGTAGAHFDAVGSGLTRWYFLKSRDGSGNTSAFSGSVTATSF
jgi:hypothetical protein